MYKKQPFMTALAALALSTAVIPDTVFAGTAAPENARDCESSEAASQDKHQRVQTCIDARLRAVTEVVGKKITQQEPIIANSNENQVGSGSPLMPSVPKIKNDGNVSADCQIWLCLPAGFPKGCGSALSAYRKRLRKGKAPLPPFASCAVGNDEQAASNGGNFTFREQSMRRIVETDGSVRLEQGTCRIRKDEWIPRCSTVYKTTIYQGKQEIGSYIE